MAAFSRRFLSQILGKKWASKSLLKANESNRGFSNKTLALLGSAGSLIVGWSLYKHRNYSKLPVVFAKSDSVKGEENKSLLGRREKRFLDFASVEFNGKIYMTPQDFLESVTEEAPRPRRGRMKMDGKEVESWLKKTPVRFRGNTHMFRSLHNEGLMSYTEYLFLLCVLTKPHSGFGIAFNMFDTDGNKKVDKTEFLVIQMSLTKCLIRSLQARLEEVTEDLWWFQEEEEAEIVSTFEKQLESMFTLLESGKRDAHIAQPNTWSIAEGSNLADIGSNLEKIFSVTSTDSEDMLGKMKKNVWDAKTGDLEFIDTTLLVHLFGQKGKDVLRYEDFHRFMDNLQTEVLELEFQAFAKGMPTISEVDFAQILLRYTVLQEEEHNAYMKRVLERVPHEEGISFNDFKQFCQFLNCLDDFAMVMRLHSFANQPVSQEEFQRAVYICTGNKLNSHVLNTVFQTFDIDGDGHLSHQEFISIMKNRLYRGSRLHTSEESRLEMFKLCVKNEMKTK